MTAAIPWALRETNALLGWYDQPQKARNGALGLKQLARLLGRTYHSVRSHAAQLGLMRPRTVLTDVAVNLRRMHKARLSMFEMSERLRISEGQVKRFLLELGLETPNPYRMTVAGRERHARNYAVWLEKQGVRSLREYVLAQDRAKAQARWPIAETPRQADLLDLLAEGPARIADLSRWIGRSTGWTEEVLRRMQRTGAVVKRRGSGPWHARGGQLPCVYELAKGVERAEVAGNGSLGVG